MGPFQDLFVQLAEHGPVLLFALAVLETCFVTGLVVPSGVATSVATILAMEGRLEFVPVVMAAGVGGFVGDSVGFWVGRRWGGWVFREGSYWSRAVGARGREMDALFRRHPIYSVTGARLVSFVRTLMPTAAGMSGMTYRRFLRYEVAGLAGWLLLYVTIGLAGRQGWRTATDVVGFGGAALFVMASVIALAVTRRRRSRARARGIAAGEWTGPAGSVGPAGSPGEEEESC
jgi:membrane protein DedA with SNARE-associated domain